MPRLLAVVFFLSGCLGTPETPQQISLEVVADTPVNPLSVTLETRWLGKDIKAELTRDQESFKTQLEGPPLRLLPVTIWVEQEGYSEPYIAYRGIELLPSGNSQLAWTLELPQEQAGPKAELTAHRVSSPRNLRSLKRWQKAQLTLGFTWLGLLLALGLRLSKSSRTESRLDPLFDWWFSPVVWIVLAVAWTWPAIGSGTHFGVGRHFDALGTIWTIDAASRLFPTFFDPLTAWPAGASYRALDSYFLLPLSWLLGFLSPVRIHGLLQVLGLALSAWAAEGFARAIGARRPFSLVAGVTFAFSGLSANVLLEGHAYHLVNPWLPLFAWSWWIATSRSGRPVHGLLAAGALAACLATTGYLGATAVLIGAGFLIGGWVRNKSTIALPVATGLGASVPLVGAYAWWLGAPDPGRVALAAIEGTGQATASLTNLVTISAEIDRADHSLAPFIGGVLIAAMVLAPRVLGSKERWRTLAGVALLAVVLSFGNRLALSPESTWFPMPMALLEGTTIGDRLRFPVRFLWAWYLCGGALAARVATAMADRFGRAATWIVAAALFEAFVVVRLPFRQQTFPTEIPTAYAESPGAVLDLFPTPTDDSGEMDRWFSALACYYQVGHQKPLVDHCATVPEGANRRVQANRWLVSALSTGATKEAHQSLSELGFSSVALHSDLFAPRQRALLEDQLASVGHLVSTTRDGGEYIQLYELKPSQQLEGTDIERLGGSLQVDLAISGSTTPTAARLRSSSGSLLGEAVLQSGDPLPGRGNGHRNWLRASWLVPSWPEGPVTLELAQDDSIVAQTSFLPHEPHLYQVLGLDGRSLNRLGPYMSTFSPTRNPTLGSVTAAGWAALLLLVIGWGVGREEKPLP